MPISSDCTQPRLDRRCPSDDSPLANLMTIIIFLFIIRSALMCRWRMPLLESRCRATMYCEPLRLTCFEEARLVLPERSMESNTRMNSFDKCTQSSIVQSPGLLGWGNLNSYHVSAQRSALIDILCKLSCTIIIRPYIASGEISSGKRLALTISAFSLLTENDGICAMRYGRSFCYHKIYSVR